MTRDSDSGQSPVDHEKIGDRAAELENLHNLEDPDAGLSDEERARIDKALLWKLDLKLIPWVRA